LNRDRLNTLNKTQKSVDVAQNEFADHSTQSGSEKFPHLNAYIQRGMGTRFTKKYQFEKEDKNDFLQFICKQIGEKKNKDMNHKVDNILEERNLVREHKKKMVSDKIINQEFAL
jgi:hypothetical protein